MKRFLLAIVLTAVILGVMIVFLPKSMQTDVYAYAPYDPTVNIYCRETTSPSVDLGLGKQVTCTLKDFKSVIATCGSVDGVSVTFVGGISDVKIIADRLQASEVSRQQLGDLFVACYYSPLIRGSVTIDGKRVNAQVAYRSGTITVGYPLILGSY